MTRPREGALLLVILVAGAWLRLRAIDRLPPPELHPDEAYYALDALKIMRGQPMVYSAANTGREALYMDLAAAVFAVFGASSTVLRAFTAVLGALTLPAIFWLGREAAPRREAAAWLGLLSAASVAALLLHVVINRNALRVSQVRLAVTRCGPASCALPRRRASCSAHSAWPRPLAASGPSSTAAPARLAVTQAGGPVNDEAVTVAVITVR